MPDFELKTPRHIKPVPALLICLLLWAAGSQIVSALSWGHDSYQITEWLINYAGGFVRRGLPGTLIGMISDATGIRASHVAIFTSLACYLTLAAWFLRRASSVFPPTLILSCIAIGFPAYQDSIIRKDCMGLLLLLACLLIEKSRARSFWKFIFINAAAGGAILCHEAFVFHALAGFVLLGNRFNGSHGVREIARKCASLLPAGACFLLTLIHHGTPAQAEVVNQSWIPLWQSIEPGNPSIGIPDASIEALGWTTEQGLSLSLHMLTSGFYQPLAWAMVFMISFLLMVLFTDRDRDRKSHPSIETRIQVTAILLSQLAFISPLFLLGVDYGRWLFLWLAGSMIFHICGRKAPLWMEMTVARMFNFARIPSLLALSPARDWYFLLFGVPVCWNIHNFLVAGPIPRHIEVIRCWF